MTKTKIRQWLALHRVIAFMTLIVLVVLGSTGSHLLSAQAVTQGYAADGQLEKGMMVSIKEEDATKVRAATVEIADKLHGVVVDANDAPVTLSAEGQKVFVATAGKYAVLVSSQNGTIKPGDYITISSLAGIGMRVDDRQPVVVGKALAEFDGKSDVIGSATVDGQTVQIGRVQADIQVARNPLQKPVSNLPDFLRRAAENIAGKPVNTSRVYLSTIIFIFSTIVAANLLYSGVRSGLISVGRNPLSKKSIVRSMMQVVIVGITIFLSGIFGVYLLLRL
jgi:hypothetical protein